MSAPALDSFKIDPTAISVSGISGGAYMAQQFHVAYSSIVMGIGVLAGGPAARTIARRATSVPRSPTARHLVR